MPPSQSRRVIGNEQAQSVRPLWPAVVIFAALIAGSTMWDVASRVQAQGCGMGTSIAADARHKILALPGVADATVDIVWDPPWTPQMISPEGRERLGMA